MTTDIKKFMGFKEWALLILLSVIWGGSFFFNKVALMGLPAFTIVWFRAGLGGIGLLVLVYATGRSMPRSPGVWRDFMIMGFFNNFIPFCLIVWGQTRIASGLASILTATTPIFTVILAHFLTRDERMSLGRLSGVILGLSGVAVIMGPGLLHNLGLNLLAQLGILAAALSYALSAIFGRRLAGRPPLVIAAGQVLSAAVILTPAALMVDRPWTLPVPGLPIMGSMLGLALLGTVLGYVIYFHLLAVAGATNLLLVTLMMPVSAVLLGVTILGESLAVNQAAGMLIIAVGLSAVDGRIYLKLKNVVRKKSVSDKQEPEYFI